MRNTYQFQWFPPEDSRRRLHASISTEGQLRLGQTLRALLPSNIQIGFDVKYRVLAIADGHGNGTQWAKGGVVAARRLSRQVTALGLELPVAFQITQDTSTGYFLGHIIPRRKRAAGGRSELDEDQIPIIYQHILESAASQMAKSTPLAERKALALEALLTAAQHYQPGYGEMEDYLEAQVRSVLSQENKFYTSTFSQRSLDQPLSPDEHSSFCLYDTLEVSSDGGIPAVDARIMAEQFLDFLSPKERRLTQLLQEGMRLPDIAQELKTTEGELTNLAHGIAQKRKDFYAA